ncbi:hypothetical protein BCV70DRAFT_98521 [Testicularia cyperi]|uniref:Uncharacterized protein n=1 Tax=Testicularia cyperi TaxID=1882483 RepID=A0A317XR99_9BASI|nr:hypothetical protein BCV70DRAFT_98521 [Testicularia cyperi]
MPESRRRVAGPADNVGLLQYETFTLDSHAAAARDGHRGWVTVVSCRERSKGLAPGLVPAHERVCHDRQRIILLSSKYGRGDQAMLRFSTQICPTARQAKAIGSLARPSQPSIGQKDVARDGTIPDDSTTFRTPPPRRSQATQA